MAEVIRLKGARVARSPTRAECMDVFVQGGRILCFGSHAKSDVDLDLTGYLLLPGLINAHDHLEFNLFPRLGKGHYANASDWARDIYRPEESPIREHLRVPKAVRLTWGAIRNLVSGVTTVAHHNPWTPSVFSAGFPVRVVRAMGWAHSLAFSPDITERWRRTPADWPFIVHAGEGTDVHARSEISRLQEMGLLSPRTVLVHALAVTKPEIEMILERRCSIVSCPTSNQFLFGQTLGTDVWRSGIRVLLATDSALTGEGDMIDEIGGAMQRSDLTAEEIYPRLTTLAAGVLRLSAGQGTICEQGVADMVAVADTGQKPAQAVAELRPEMVMVRGRVMLMSARFAECGAIALKGFHSMQLEGRGSWMVRADVPSLYRAACAAIGPEVRLGGKRVCL